MDKLINFESKHFAEGRFRRAYLGTWQKPISKRGQLCVVKELKDEFTWKPSDWDTTKLIQGKAQQMAEGFNAYSNTNYPVRFTDIEVMQVTRNDDPEATLRVGESVIVEEYIEGKFKKWCSNYGFISQEAKTTAISMPAFMHWSWWYNSGQMMVADLQGVKQNDSYLLTDPVILSDTTQYGCTDMGVEGMAMFFINHNCNLFCQALPAPTLNDFTGVIPADMLLMCRIALPSMQNCTAYKSELKFSRPVKNLVLQTFRNVATRVT